MYGSGQNRKIDVKTQVLTNSGERGLRESIVFSFILFNNSDKGILNNELIISLYFKKNRKLIKIFLFLFCNY